MRALTRRSPASFRPKPVSLRARWRGDAPEPGQYLMSERGRLAYLIHEVKRVHGLPALGSYNLRIKCWRTARSELPPGAVVWPWIWDKRTPRAARLHAA